MKEFLQENDWELNTEQIHFGFFKLEKIISETRIVVHSQIRLLEVEERVRNAQNDGQEVPEFLGETIDKDDLMRRLAENIDDERYLKMLSIFYVGIAKEGEDKAVLFQCKTVESDLIVEYVCTINSKDIGNRSLVVKSANLYRGVESMMLDDNYRIGLHEYLHLHSVDEDFCSAVEHLAIILRTKAKDQIYTKLKDFALLSIRA